MVECAAPRFVPTVEALSRAVAKGAWRAIQSWGPTQQPNRDHPPPSPCCSHTPGQARASAATDEPGQPNGCRPYGGGAGCGAVVVCAEQDPCPRGRVRAPRSAAYDWAAHATVPPGGLGQADASCNTCLGLVGDSHCRIYCNSQFRAAHDTPRFVSAVDVVDRVTSNAAATPAGSARVTRAAFDEYVHVMWGLSKDFGVSG